MLHVSSSLTIARTAASRARLSSVGEFLRAMARAARDHAAAGRRLAGERRQLERQRPGPLPHHAATNLVLSLALLSLTCSSWVAAPSSPPFGDSFAPPCKLPS